MNNILSNGMRRALTIIVLFLNSLAAKADLPGPAFQYDLFSQNKLFYFKSIPFYNFDQTEFGKTTVYDAKTKKELYHVDNYLPQQAFLTNNGESLITTTYWMAGHSNFYDQPLITFYSKENNKKILFLNDLVKDETKLQFTSSHTLWYDRMFINNDTLFVITLDNAVVLIDADNARILAKKPLSFVTDRFDVENLPQLESIVYDTIKYPGRWQFPDLLNGRNFKAELVKDLHKTEVKEYDSCRFYIQLYGTIDRKGRCEIFMLQASVNKNEADDPGWKKQVADWVIRQKYKTDLIPVNCDKWVFSEYFYLK